jgi:hypothetical protein
VSEVKPRVRVSTIVATDPADAFEVFTQETALWWRRDPRSEFRRQRQGPFDLKLAHEADG